MRYNDPNRPITIDDPRPVERKKEMDTGNIHVDGYRVEKRRPRSRHMVDSVDLETARMWDKE